MTGVPGHRDVEGIKTADQLARLGSECSFIGPEPVCDISAGFAKKAARDWTKRDHRKYWESLTELKHAMSFL
jgi:hypothetical protein